MGIFASYKGYLPVYFKGYRIFGTPYTSLSSYHNYYSTYYLHKVGFFLLFTDAFDREYRLAFTRLSAGELKRLQRDDRPRTDNVMWCRKVFMDLEV